MGNVQRCDVDVVDNCRPIHFIAVNTPLPKGNDLIKPEAEC
jgi:hypothetical protein